MASSERTVLIAENPRAGADDADRLLDRLVRGLVGRGFRVVRECDPEAIRQRLQAAPNDAGWGATE